jgi:hypothetical protein
MNGRMTGFSHELSIPVLVSPAGVLSFIAENAQLIMNVEISPVTQNGTFLFPLDSFFCLVFLQIFIR